MNKLVLFADKPHPILEERLTAAGFVCRQFNGSTLDELEAIIADYVGIIVRSRTKITSATLDKARQLKFIGRLGSGMENIDVAYAEQKGIACLSSPEGNCNAVGEHALGMLLTLINHIHTSDREVRNGIWQREANRGLELQGKTIGIIGFGHTGPAFARCLSGLGMKILVYDKYKSGFGVNYINECSMDRIFAEADIVSLHVPLTSETHYLLNDKFLDNFKKNVFVINTSRGEVLETAALARALKSGKVTGAALDVIEYENLLAESFDNSKTDESFHYLASLPNVVLTPHIAGVTKESYFKLADVLADKILDLFGGFDI